MGLAFGATVAGQFVTRPSRTVDITGRNVHTGATDVRDAALRR
jgi:probable blue pigment (indigoidine) exporter